MAGIGFLPARVDHPTSGIDVGYTSIPEGWLKQICVSYTNQEAAAAASKDGTDVG
jgi:hypothetical protein